MVSCATDGETPLDAFCSLLCTVLTCTDRTTSLFFVGPMGFHLSSIGSTSSCLGIAMTTHQGWFSRIRVDPSRCTPCC